MTARFVKPDPIDLLPGGLPAMVRNYLTTHAPDAKPPFVTLGSQPLLRDPKSRRRAVWRTKDGTEVVPQYQYIGRECWKVIVIRFTKRPPVLVASAKAAGRVTTRSRDLDNDNLQSAYYVWQGGDDFEDEPSVFKIYPPLTQAGTPTNRRLAHPVLGNRQVEGPAQSEQESTKRSYPLRDREVTRTKRVDSGTLFDANEAEIGPGDESDDEYQDDLEGDEGEEGDDGGEMALHPLGKTADIRKDSTTQSTWKPRLGPLHRTSTSQRRSNGSRFDASERPSRAPRSASPVPVKTRSVYSLPSFYGPREPAPVATRASIPTRIQLEAGAKRKLDALRGSETTLVPRQKLRVDNAPESSEVESLASMIDLPSMEAAEQEARSDAGRAVGQCEMRGGFTMSEETPPREPENAEGTPMDWQKIHVASAASILTPTLGERRDVEHVMPTESPTTYTVAATPIDIKVEPPEEGLFIPDSLPDTVIRFRSATTSKDKAFRFCNTVKKLFTQAAAARLFDNTTEDGRVELEKNDDDLLRVEVGGLEARYVVRGDDESYNEMIEDIRSTMLPTLAGRIEHDLCVVVVTKP